MPRIASLWANLALEDASFVSGLKRAEKEQARAMKAMASAGNVFVGVMKGMATAAAGVFSAQLVTDALDYAGSIGEVSQQLGVTTKDLQVYRYAATQVNLSNEQMEKGLAKLTLEIGQGNKAFQQLGISTKDSSGNLRTAGDVLPELAEKLSAIKSPAEQARVLVELFGRSGQALGPLLMGGKAALQEFADEAERTGQVLSDKAIQNADIAADKIAKFKNALRVSVASAVAENATAIASLSDVITDLIGGMSRMIAKAGEARKIADIMGAARGDKEYLGGLIKVRGKGDLTSKGFIGALMNNALADAEAFGGGSAPAVGGGDPPAVSTSGVPKSVRRAAASAKKLQQSSAELRLDGVADAGVLNVSRELAANFDASSKSMLEIRDYSKEIGESARFTALEDARDLFGSMADNAAQAAINGQNIWKAMLSGIRATAIEWAASGLKDMLFGQKGTTGGGLLGSIVQGIGALFARESGGPVMGNRAYLVGERGPEVIVPRGAGDVISNASLRGGGGRAPVFDLRGAVMTADLMAQMQALAAQGAIAAIGVGRSDMAAARRMRLPRGMGA